MAAREVVYPTGRAPQGVDERVIYTVTTTEWASTPTSPSVVVYDVTGTARTNVTSTVMPVNSPTVLGDVITLSLLRALTADHTYRVEVQFTASGNLFECFFLVRAEQ
jgi:hypothetical protein